MRAPLKFPPARPWTPPSQSLFCVVHFSAGWRKRPPTDCRPSEHILHKHSADGEEDGEGTETTNAASHTFSSALPQCCRLARICRSVSPPASSVTWPDFIKGHPLQETTALLFAVGDKRALPPCCGLKNKRPLQCGAAAGHKFNYIWGEEISCLRTRGRIQATTTGHINEVDFIR